MTNKDEMREIAKELCEAMLIKSGLYQRAGVWPSDVAEHQIRLVTSALQKVADEAVKKEREECAKVCDCDCPESDCLSKRNAKAIRERTNQACKEKYVELPHEAYDRGFKNGFEACKRMAVNIASVASEPVEVLSDIPMNKKYVACGCGNAIAQAIEALKPEKE